MKVSTVVVLTLCQFCKISFALEPITTTLVLGASGVALISTLLGEYVGLSNFRCKSGLIECCGSTHIQPNMTGLKYELNNLLFGQHLVNDVAFRAVKSHLDDENPHKPLVMSFHGWTGGGKNYVTRMIVDNIYVKKQKSSFVHIFNAEVDFKHASQVSLYKDQLQSWLHGNVSRCGRSIFIFDEMDHMPEGLIDAIKPYLGTDPIHHVDFRKSIFIFLSNTGGNAVVKKTIEIWQEGRSRESIKLSEMQAILAKSAYNQKSGLRYSGIVEKNLIDHFIPFLPLERHHVRKCIKVEVDRLNIKKPIAKTVYDEIMDELLWFPADTRLYSQSGCKKISQKVKIVLNS
ncbi:torsin-1A-like [Clavelina lepadiformis]|uniref:Torsin-1A C-terminal domain-containing protein n=1 Tax=Clavelina lepadiformis TaxID=159417 RepID=A0ABP0FAF9_CLALP